MYSPAEIANNFINTGITKTSLPKLKMLLLGIFAGAFIAFAGAGSSVASCMVTDASIGRILSAVIFPAGLLMVILAGSELFTGNSLIIISVLEKRVKISAMLTNWVIVYIGNLVGSVLVAAAFVYGHVTDLFDGCLAESVVAAAAGKCSMSFQDALIKGILCNILVCIAVWIAAGAKDFPGKILGLFFPIAVFVLCGFEHSIANMFFIPAGIFAGAEYGITGVAGLGIAGFLHNLIPVTLGNIIGGVLVGAGYRYIYLKK